MALGSSSDDAVAAIKKFNEKFERVPRRLSGHIATRPYRAPELILLEKHYHTGVDIWALGVIIYELFSHVLGTNKQDSDK